MHELRETRKIEHIRQSLALEDGPLSNGFADVHLIHNALPELKVEDIDLSLTFLGKKLEKPILINAITGGHPAVTEINRKLANLAAQKKIAIAVGSQAAGLRNADVWSSYSVVRQMNPDGVVIANINADTPLRGALKAIDVIEADAIQVHLNGAQELAMREGDRDFTGWAGMIKELIRHSPVPVIVKEVGFGISKEVALRLWDMGVTYLDVGGAGGTNFVAIELRRQEVEDHSFEAWGIPTAITLGEVMYTLRQNSSDREDRHVIATGGIRNGWEGAKALAMGADLIGLAGPLLKRLDQEQAMEEFIENFQQDLTRALLLTGSKKLKELRQQPCVYSGFVKTWFEQRGIILSSLS
ncbi:type 2 isopentenyl-diphosphate Delta-isomerase [Heliorestis acidaminivorans]|uniref:Isopentenyl-diphosphate delta-isomerase n=1 Tax=Heliorestis acidaminivorans TaxID=553427 RepID=A0A6I0EXR3_9FIRM|nr:type 2 isopentenyl-diphosphate Delta-isomerase [Heliorestis acidaminivorans]KAB2954589.1 type 2 isopentenyl-diphosphate Delta-isomerase [Heliorestis acidaminivorans]